MELSRWTIIYCWYHHRGAFYGDGSNLQVTAEGSGVAMKKKEMTGNCPTINFVGSAAHATYSNGEIIEITERSWWRGGGGCTTLNDLTIVSLVYQ